MGFYIRQNGTAKPVGGGMSPSEKDRLAALEQKVAQLEAGMATTENYGLAKISESEAVTETDSGLVLGAREKNAAIEGTIANLMQQSQSDISEIFRKFFTFRSWTGNFDAVSQTGLYQYSGGGGTGIPEKDAYGMLLHLQGGSYRIQLFFGIHPLYRNMYYRDSSSLSGEYRDWKKMNA